jgi:hypothetical protein
MKFVSLNMVERGAYDEDMGRDREELRPVVVNAANVRCFYPRKGEVVGTRITFADGGGFAVAEEMVEVARLLGVDPDVLVALPTPVLLAAPAA